MGKKELNNDLCNKNKIRGSTMNTGSGSKEKMIFFPNQSSYIHRDHKPNSIKRRKHGKVGRGGTNWARGRKQLLRAESWVQRVTTMASKGKEKKKGNEGNLQIFLSYHSEKNKVVVGIRSRKIWGDKERRQDLCLQVHNESGGTVHRETLWSASRFLRLEWTVCCFSKSHCA